MASDDKQYDREFFEEWNRTCRVKKIAARANEIAHEAKKNNRTVDEEMKERGYKDYGDFAKGCEQFSLTCWPEELAELGSGFVLYFQFLGFLSFVLLLTFAFGIPGVTQNASADDWAVGWHWSKWQDMWSDNSANCNCVGSNNGHRFVSSDSDYGTSCKAWDRQLCLNATLSIQERGKWCCATWCYAKPECQAPRTGAPSIQNRHCHNLVRATDSCIQDFSPPECASYADTAFNEPGVDEGPNNDYISKMWLTPGVFGPDQAESKLVPMMWFILICAISFFTLVMYQHQIFTDSKVDAGTTTPSDFAVMVSGLPATAYDEQALRVWFEKNILKDRECEIVKVVVGWDAQEFNERKKKIQELQVSLKDKDADSDEYKEIKNEILKIKSDLVRCASDNAARLRSSGVVVVVFRYQGDLRAALRRWGSFWATWFYCDAVDMCPSCFPEGNGLLKGPSLPRFPIDDRPTYPMKVVRAANPGDIHWEELGKTNQETAKLFMKTNCAMIALIVVCFGFTYGLQQAQAAVKDGQKNQGGMGTTVLSFLPGLGVAIVNALLMISARKLGDKEYHETWTSQEFSQGAKMAFALLINTAAVLLFSNLQPKEWYGTGGLIDDALFILIMDALLPPCIFYLDIRYAIKGASRRKLSPDRLAGWNQSLQQCKAMPDKTPQEKSLKNQARQQVDAEVEQFKRQFEPSEMDYPRRYANALNTFFCALLFAPIFPYTPLIGIAGLLLQYWIDKYMLLRWYKRPKRPYNAALAQYSLRMVKYLAPLFLAVSFYFFLSPSWKDKGEVTFPFLCSLVVVAGMLFVPSSFLRTLLGLRCIMWAQGIKESDGGDGDYYSAQYMWSKEMKYHKDHFLYKCLSEAKNPEMLTPGDKKAVGLDDIKDSYGAATQQAADSAGTGQESAAAIKGQKLHFGASGSAVGADGADTAPEDGPKKWGAATKPTAVGASSAPAPELVPISALPTGPTPVTEDSPADAPAASMPSSAPAVPSASSGHPPLADASATAPPDPRAGGKAVWEFETDKGFRPFDSDCQDYVEKKYQEFLTRQAARKRCDPINVKTKANMISVDFAKMTSQVKDSHKIRAIRRKES